MKRIIATILTIITLLGTFTIAASAASYDTNYGSYPAPTRTLYYKKAVLKGNDVKYFQCAINYLVANGKLNTSKLNVDGSFGPACKTATIAFQRTYGLSADGSFGPASRTKMASVLRDVSNSVSSGYNLIWPTTSRSITGKYGTHGSLRSNGTRYHSGIDIGAKVGDPCYAAADGVVVMCKSSNDASGTIGGRGRYIVIYHSNGNFSSLYEHLNSVSVKVGDSVKVGQKIGTTGNSGWQSKGKPYAAHLHFGLMKGKMTNTGYDLWTVPGKTYNGKSYANNTFEPDPNYNTSIRYTYK